MMQAQSQENFLQESLLQKLEEKTMMLLTEVEQLRKENKSLKEEVASLKHEAQRAHHESVSLKVEREGHAKKLQDLISLLDAVNGVDASAASQHISAIKPVLIQG